MPEDKMEKEPWFGESHIERAQRLWRNVLREKTDHPMDMSIIQNWEAHKRKW